MKLLIIIIFFTAFAIAGFMPRHAVHSNTTLHLKHWVGDKPLQLFDTVYLNNFGEPFTVSKFKYYISQLSVTDINNKQSTLSNQYFLVNEEDAESKNIQLSATAPIRSISFWIGVDSARNVSRVQTGSLDPVNTMFWTWNSGYIFAKLEGRSDASHAPAHSFSWDVGGFKQGENALRKIVLVLEKPATGDITVNANLLKWFDAAHVVKIAVSPVCHQPGQLAMQLADNYSRMFTIAP